MSDELRTVRDALWHWFAFGAWEKADLSEVSEDRYESIELAARDLLAEFCVDLGHQDNGYGACVFCEGDPE